MSFLRLNISNPTRLWQRVGIITAVFLITVFFAVVAPTWESLIFVIILIVLGLGALSLLRWAPFGFIVLIVVSMIMPTELPLMGTASTILLGLIGLWIVNMIIFQRKITLINSPTIWPLILFTAVSILAFLFGQLPWFPIPAAPLDGQFGGLAIFIVSFGAFLLVASQIEDIRWLKAMTFIFIALAGLYFVLRIVPPLRIFLGFYSHGVVGGLFWVWISAFSLSQAMYNKTLKSSVRGLLFIVVLSCFFVALVQGRGWTSGWMPSVITVFVLLWVGSPRAALAVTILGGGLALTQIDTILNEFIFIGDNSYSSLTRLEAWRIVGEIVKVNPILGVGPANYRSYTALFPILGWFVEFNSHNNYVDIIAQTGLVGMACLLWFFREIGKVAWRTRLRVKPYTFEYAYVVGSIAGLVGTIVSGMLGDWVIPFVYNIGVTGVRSSMFAWLFLGGVVAIERIYLAQERAVNEQ